MNFFKKDKGSPATTGTRTDTFSSITSTTSISSPSDTKDSRSTFSTPIKFIRRVATNLSTSSKSQSSQITMPSTTSAANAASTAIVTATGSGHTPSAYTTKYSTADDNDSKDLSVSLAEYHRKRHAVQRAEAKLAFDDVVRDNATLAEQIAHKILVGLKAKDDKDVYAKAEMHHGYGNQLHKPFAGDHYLTNVELIEKTQVFEAAQHMPKGAHLHIHFNACLAPTVLLDIASRMERMFIKSTLPLVVVDGENPLQNFYLSEIAFEILAVGNDKPGNLLSAEYESGQHMPFRNFLDTFPSETVGMSAMDWLVSKLVFGEKEAYDIPQTASGAWTRFNGRTRMMKGLFNYKSAYTEYTKLFLESLLQDNIQYAEIRPNFMMANQLWTDDGTAKLDNFEIVQLIVDACEEFKLAHTDKNFDGIKIIYCTPRSFKRHLVRDALKQCIEFKQKWPTYIAGFDLVGEEGMGEPLYEFVPELLEFQQACAEVGVEIPFLFHCAETLDKGTSVDGNLYDALLLKSKRIGHGFALPNHPHVMAEMKKNNVCVEVCPISNEILGLTPRIGGHAVYNLLANNVPCTVASDNGTLFRSTLSHDFYQVLVGKPDMGLYGWRRLAEWSLEHSCFDAAERQAARARWLSDWRDYVVWLIATHGGDDAETRAVLAQITANKALAAVEISL